MSQTILQLVQSACYRSNSLQVPSALVASSNSGDLQLLHLLYSVGEELRAMKVWPQLKRRFKVRLVAGQDRYDPPADYFAELPFTAYDRSNSWAAMGPMTDADWNLRVVGTNFMGTTKAFRLFGTGGGEFQVNPTPGAGDNMSVMQIEYISKSWLQPPAWTASEAAVAQNVYRSARGIIYKKTDSGTDTAGTVRPTMEFGEGQDGSVRWLALTTSAFAGTTAYAPGSYFTSGGRLYRVTVGGTSSGSAPTSTTEDTDITNGTLTCRYHSAASWTAETAYTFHSHILISSQYYRCEQAGITGLNQPTWDATTFTDNTITWTFQDIAYETARTDSDTCVFDDELMIAGLRAKLFLARGLGSDDLVVAFEKLKQSAVARWNVGKVLDLAAGAYSPRPFANLPEGNWPTW